MQIARRQFLTDVAGLLAMAAASRAAGRDAFAAPVSLKDPKVTEAVKRGLDFLAREQRRQGYWEATGGQYRVAMTSLAGNALACEGSTTTRGKYAENIKLAVDYLIELANPDTGLIGYSRDYHYTYGHGFAMLFLSQIFGEEEDLTRRQDLRKVLTKAVDFSVGAQTPAGGWGYVSHKDQPDFDEGSTCVTQVQGLRACRNAGIPVPQQSIKQAVEYIKRCTASDGGVQYSIRGGGTRPAITAAAIASLFNAGEYDNEYVKKLMDYCEKNVWPGSSATRYFGHWHYTHYYYAQVMYRMGDEKWKKYFDYVSKEIVFKQSPSGAWKEGPYGPVYPTSINLTILQLDNGFLPIYQR